MSVYAVALGLLALASPSPEQEIRQCYAKFDRLLSRGDASFLSMADPKLVYVAPDGSKSSYKEWSEGFRRACRFNREPKSITTIVKVEKQGASYVVHTRWEYSFKQRRKQGLASIVRYSKSIDTWQFRGGKPVWIASKDMWTLGSFNGIMGGLKGPAI